MKAAFYTLGCKVNQYETETIREQFRQGGYEIVSEDEPADVYVVNTCTVTNLADRKSRQCIRKAHRMNPDAVIAVTGCYAEMDKEKVASIEGVSVVTGTDSKSEVFDEVEKYIAGRNGSESAGSAEVKVKPYDELNRYEELGVITGMEGRTRAFIKIQEGCDRFCSYCIIPFARGKVRSRDTGEIVSEVKGLIEHGYKEIVLTGINTALYGTDLGYGGIAPLIEALDELPGDFRIRLSSLEPTVIDADYAAGLLKYGKLCHHLHLSAQSGSDKIISAMNRHYTRDDYLRIVQRLRNADPYYGVSADIIVGFPGETHDDLMDSVDLVKESELVKTHVFKYSPRKGTKAAVMPDQVDEKVKNLSSKVMISAGEAAQTRFLSKCKGIKRRVLFEQKERDMATGYTDNYIKVYVPLSDAGDLLGEFSYVEIGDLYRDGVKAEIIREI